MTLSRYLMKAFLVRFAALLIGLVFFLQTLDLLATANEVMAGGGAAVPSLMRYVMLRMPSLVETVAPLAGLLGALTALVVMAMNSEILAMRAAGRSVLGLIGGLVGVGLALSIMLFIFSEFVVVRANAELEEWRESGYGAGGEVATGENSWVMEGNTIIRVGHVVRNGTVLHDVSLFKQDDSSKVTDIISIRLAIWENDAWSTVEIQRVSGDVGDDEPIVWDTQLKPEHFGGFANHPNELSLTALQQYIGNVPIGSRPIYFYNTWLQQKIAGPIVLALMPLLAGIAAFAHHRQGGSVMTVVWGVSIGFAFIIVDNVLIAMGQYGSLPPLMAAWLPIALFGVIGVWIVFLFEHTGVRS